MTICTHHRRQIFGDIHDGEMRLSPYSHAAQFHLLDLINHFSTILLDEYVVMPNHVHIILFLEPTGEHRPNLSTIIGTYKAAVSRTINQIRSESDSPIWQSRYHDVIIRNDTMLQKLREYTIHNPALWENDRFYER